MYKVSCVCMASPPTAVLELGELLACYQMSRFILVSVHQSVNFIDPVVYIVIHNSDTADNI